MALVFGLIIFLLQCGRQRRLAQTIFVCVPEKDVYNFVCILEIYYNTFELVSFHSKLEICCPNAMNTGFWIRVLSKLPGADCDAACLHHRRELNISLLNIFSYGIVLS